MGLNGLVKRCFRQGGEPYLHLYPHSSSGGPGMAFQGRARTRQSRATVKFWGVGGPAR